MIEEILIDLSELYSGTAKLNELSSYLEAADRMPVDGKAVVLTGNAPVWLYLKFAHHLHGRAKKLYYQSPAAGRVLIFDHDPYGER